MIIIPTIAKQPNVIGDLTLIPSSFIRDIKYNFMTKELIVKMKGGKSYTYPNIKQRIAMRFIQGKAVCLTNDIRKKMRWYKGKSPSIGAYYNQFIKVGGVKGSRTLRAAGARIVRAKLKSKGGKSRRR